MSVKIVGLDELRRAFNAITDRLSDNQFVVKALHQAAQSYAHVDTGYMKGSGQEGDNYVEFVASYAGYEADRGGSHDFGQQAVDAFAEGDYLNWLTEPY